MSVNEKRITVFLKDGSQEKIVIENLGLKPRRSTTALLLNMSIVYEIYAKM
jgi:hypothetical protein